MCKQVKIVQSVHKEDFLGELDKMIKSTGKLENTRHTLEWQNARNDSNTAEQLDAVQKEQKSQGRMLTYYKDSAASLWEERNALQTEALLSQQH